MKYLKLLLFLALAVFVKADTLTVGELDFDIPTTTKIQGLLDVKVSIGGNVSLLNNDSGYLTSASSLNAAKLTGNIGVSNLNSGTGSSASTYWRGDGSWAAIIGGVTNGQTGLTLGISGGTISNTTVYGYSTVTPGSLGLQASNAVGIVGGSIINTTLGGLTYPSADGTTNQYLGFNGNGTLTPKTLPAGGAATTNATELTIGTLDAARLPATAVRTDVNNTFAAGTTNLFIGRTMLGGNRAAVATPWVFGGYTINAAYPNVTYGDTSPDGTEGVIHAFLVTNKVANTQSYIYIGDNNTADGIKLGKYKAEGAFLGFKTDFKIYDSARTYYFTCNETSGLRMHYGGYAGVSVSAVGLVTLDGAAGTKIGSSGTAMKQGPSATASLGFPTALTVGQYEDATISVTPSTNNNAVIPGLPTDVPADSVFTMFVSSPNTVTVRRSAITTCAAYTNTFRATVITY